MGVASPTMKVASRAARGGIPLPTSSKKKKVTVSAAKVALPRHVANATTRSVSSAGTPGNLASTYCPNRYHGTHAIACPGG